MLKIEGKLPIAETEKTELCPELLMATLIETLYKKDIINSATFLNAQKEMNNYDKSTIS